MKKLPRIPSKLIRLAVKDLQLVENDKNYRVNMSEWHSPAYYRNPDKNVCMVCLAGSVMAKSLNTEPLLTLDPDVFSRDIALTLSALDSFRKGLISCGLRLLGYNLHGLDDCIEVYVHSYYLNPKQFKKDMSKMADIFESLGL